MRLGERDETAVDQGAARLIAHVEGAALHDADGTRIGSIRNVIVDKQDGCARIAVVALGGLLPIGERLYPLPWEALDYDEDRDRYVIAIDKDAFRKAPSFEPGQEPAFDRSYERLVRRHYGFPV